MNQCPYCQNTEHQIKAGRTAAGSQRYRCKPCDRRYTPQPSQMYSDEMRRRAVQLYADGMNYRQTGRHLGVDHVTVMNWVKAHVDQLPAAEEAIEEPAPIVEMDELYTFVGRKKAGGTLSP